MVVGCFFFFLCGPYELKSRTGCNLSVGRDSSDLVTLSADKVHKKEKEKKKEKVLTRGIQGIQGKLKSLYLHLDRDVT